MKKITVLLGSRLPASVQLLKSLKEQGVEVNVMGPVALMTEVYQDTTAFLNLHIGEPTLESLKALNGEVLLYDPECSPPWLDQVDTPKVAWGRFFSSSKEVLLCAWPLPFSLQWGKKYCYGSEQAAINYLNSLVG